MHTINGNEKAKRFPGAEIQIRARLTNPGNKKECWLQLPASATTALEALQSIGVDGRVHRSYELTTYVTYVGRMSDFLPVPASLNELNYLAARVEEAKRIDGEEIQLFTASLECDMHTDSIASLINLTLNYDAYELAPAYDMETYGEFLRDLQSDMNSKAFNRLRESPDPDDRALADYIERLEANIDLVKLATEIVEKEGGAFTSFGYLHRLGVDKEVYRGIEDIPVEFSISPEFKRLKVLDTDLTFLVHRMQLPGNNYSDCSGMLLHDLTPEHGNQLLMIRPGQATIIPERELYATESNAQKAIMEYLEQEPHDHRWFMLYPKGIEGGHLIGDLIEVDADRLQESIREHSIGYSLVKATSPVDNQALEAHLQEVKSHICSNEHTVAISAEELLDAMDARYMEQASCPKPGMIRVCYEVAKALWVSLGGDVRLLLPDCVEKVSLRHFTSNAVRDGEYAIPKECKGVLDSYAKQMLADAAMREEQRAKKKSKDNHER